MKLRKKAQSQIVTSVLLILIVVAMGVLIFNFAVPFVRDRLEGTNCLDVVGQVTFSNNPQYTCYDDKGDMDGTNDEVLLQVHIGDSNESLAGFAIELGGAATKSIEIKAGNTDPDGVRMFGKLDTDPLELPGRNEERTYVILLGGIPTTINLYPLLTDGKTCEATDSIKSLDLCDN